MMTTTRLKAALAALAMACVTSFAAGAAGAATQTYAFTGTEIDLNGSPGGVATGIFSYDPTSAAIDTFFGLPLYPGTFSVSISGGRQDGGSLSTTTGNILIGQNEGFVFYPLGRRTNQFNFFQILASKTGTALPDPLDTSLGFLLRLQTDQLGLPQGTFSYQSSFVGSGVTRVTDASVIPLPAGAILLLSGLGAVGVMRMCRKGHRA